MLEFMSCPQNAGKTITKTAKTLENVARLERFGATLTNQNCNDRETKRSLNSRHACCHSVRKLWPSCLVFKYVHITTVLLHWCVGPVAQLV